MNDWKPKDWLTIDTEFTATEAQFVETGEEIENSVLISFSGGITYVKASGPFASLRAIGRFYVDPSGDTAEISFLVHESARRKGIAQYLLAEMARLFVNFGAERKSITGEDSAEFWIGIEDLLENKTATNESEIGIFASGECLKHDTGSDHPESPERNQAVLDALATVPGAKRIAPRIATVDDVLLVHSASYHDLVRIDIDEFRDCLRTGDTAISEDSYEVVMKALGGVLQAGDEVMSGAIRAAFCAVRPPGHHATRDRGMGFCIFNHTAVLARYLQKKHGIGRVAILDWDVHHGNGTQNIFYDSSDVLYVSSHQEGVFPNTGLKEGTGAGEGTGATLNFPLPMGTQDAALIHVWEAALERVEAFVPEVIIISAGFDAAAEGPMADFLITADGFGILTRMVRDTADRICGGKLISVLEGGYDPTTLAACVLRHVEVLGGD